MSILRHALLSLILCVGVSHAGAQVLPRDVLVAGAYVLAPGDRIKVSVFQSPEFSIELRLPDEGVVAYPMVGPIVLAGLTLTQAQQRIAQVLVDKRLVRDPQVVVTVTEFRGTQVAVLGHAVRPGRYVLDSPAIRLSDLMALAGGISPEASDLLTVTGLRQGKPFKLTVDFRRLSTGSDPELDIVMQRNDVVYVAVAPRVYLYGEVQRPGALRLEPGMRLLHALAAAGGPTLRGTQRGIRISRVGADGRLAETTPGLHEVLQPEDVVFVPASLF